MKTAQFAVRRRQAKIAFAIIVFEVAAIFLGAALGGAEFTKGLSEANMLLLPLNTFLTGVILAYHGQVAVDDYQTKKLDHNKG